MDARCLVCRELRGDVALPGGFLLEDAAAAAFHYRAEWVYSAVIGMGVPHFHLHLLPRYSGTPRDVPWHSVDECEGGRHGGAHEIAELVARLKTSLEGD